MSKKETSSSADIDARELKTFATHKNADIVEIPKNIKRDPSFASSYYKEQLADLQLRKEIAEKNSRKAGILTDEKKQTKAVEHELISVEKSSNNVDDSNNSSSRSSCVAIPCEDEYDVEEEKRRRRNNDWKSVIGCNDPSHRFCRIFFPILYFCCPLLICLYLCTGCCCCCCCTEFPCD